MYMLTNKVKSMVNIKCWERGLVVLMLGLGCVAVPSLAEIYTVGGDTQGWALGVDYTAWAANTTFQYGDRLEFKFESGHSVAEVSLSEYSACTIGNAIWQSPDNVTVFLVPAGTHYFICGTVEHCNGGMKLAVFVTAPPPPIIPVGNTPTAVSTDVPMPSITGSTYTVGDASGWRLGIDYNNIWAAGKTFKVGDGLVFKYDASLHSLVEVTASEYSSCNVISSLISTTGDTTVILVQAGNHYFISAAAGDCFGGMKLAIRVRGTTGGGGSIAARSDSAPFMHLAFLFFVYLVLFY